MPPSVAGFSLDDRLGFTFFFLPGTRPCTRGSEGPVRRPARKNPTSPQKHLPSCKMGPGGILLMPTVISLRIVGINQAAETLAVAFTVFVWLGRARSLLVFSAPHVMFLVSVSITVKCKGKGLRCPALRGVSMCLASSAPASKSHRLVGAVLSNTPTSQATRAMEREGQPKVRAKAALHSSCNPRGAT